MSTSFALSKQLLNFSLFPKNSNVRTRLITAAYIHLNQNQNAFCHRNFHYSLKMRSNSIYSRIINRNETLNNKYSFLQLSLQQIHFQPNLYQQNGKRNFHLNNTQYRPTTSQNDKDKNIDSSSEQSSSSKYPTEKHAEKFNFQKYIGDKLENVQERVEDKYPEKFEHLKQKEGESDAQHRKRLLGGLADKVKEFVRKYGILGVVLYFGIYFANIALFYVMLESGLFKKEEIITKLKNWGMDKHFDLDKLIAGKKTSFAIAWIMTKMTEPIRMFLTITIVPFLSRRLVALRLMKNISNTAKKI